MPGGDSRKLFSAGEWLTLLGMALVVIGASLPWRRAAADPAATMGALYVRPPRPATGFELRVGPANVGWVVTASAIVCAALLLFAPSQRERGPFLVLQTVLSSVILGLASFHVGGYVGIYCAVLGALLLMAGGVLRYR